jgi:hypothetical protein
MGVGLVTIFDRDLPDADAFRTETDGGKSVAAFLPLLDEIAATKGLPPFSRFVVELDDIDWDEVDPDDMPALWFDPSEGLEAVPTLVGALRAEGCWAESWPESSRQEGVDQVVWSLQQLARDLEVARLAGARFSLSFA